MKSMIAILLVTLSLPAFSAKSPLWTSVDELKVVLGASANEMLAKTEFFGAIDSVEKVEDLTYRLSSEDCIAIVTLNRHVPDHPGPTSFSFKGLETACRLH